MRKKLIEKIYRAGLFIHMDYELPSGQCYLSYGSESYIVVSSHTDFDSLTYSYALAHELAHFRIYERRSPRRKGLFLAIRYNWNLGYFRYFPFIWWDESIAWLEGYKICKETGINTKEYWLTARREMKSYLRRCKRVGM